LCRICGVDLTRINGIETSTALKVIAEVGPDLSRFKSAKHFASWLGLCPGTKISGGKVLSAATKRTASRLAQALRMAAFALSCCCAVKIDQIWGRWSKFSAQQQPAPLLLRIASDRAPTCA